MQATAEDHRSKMVRRCIWWKAGALGIGMLGMAVVAGEGGPFPADAPYALICSGGLPFGIPPERYGEVLVDLLCFGVLQRFFFSRMYGRADAYAFSRCSLVLASFGGGLKEYLMHMLVAVVLLGAVQGVKGNVGSNGNLKVPVAFVPYISAAFFVCVLGMKVSPNLLPFVK